MPYDYFCFPEPVAASPVCALRLDDSGLVLIAVPGTHSTGRPGQVFTVPDGTPDAHGASLTITADTYEYTPLHGVLRLGKPYCEFHVDTFTGVPVPEVPPPGGGGPEPPEPPGMPTDPLGIINHVYATGLYNLATHEGCGKFTEACALALYQYNFPLWGHIKKTPPQNEYNGHAVDAVMCLGGVETGIWDIIFSSVSPEAKPAYNYKGPADPALWLPPTGAPSRLLQSVLVVHPSLEAA